MLHPSLPSKPEFLAGSSRSESTQSNVQKRKRSPFGDTPILDTEWKHTPWLDSLPMTEYDQKEQRLHDEIVAFVSFMQPNEQELQARAEVLAKIRDLITTQFVMCKISTYGSVAHGLCLPDGDLDLAIETSDIYDRRDLIRRLFQLSSAFRNSGMTSNCQVISHARVPILKLETSPELASYHFDININSADGLKAVPVIKGYLDEFPALQALILVVKTFLAKKGLHSAATGGLSSYAAICLIVAFLKLNPGGRDQQFLQNPMENEALGFLLLDFFDFYGNKFPYETSYVSATEGKILSKKNKGWTNEQRPKALSIECLVEPLNDVGKSAQKVPQIRLAFQQAYRALADYQLSLNQGNMLGSIVGVPDTMLSHRDRIRQLVDSGDLQRNLAAITLPSSWDARERERHASYARRYQQASSSHYRDRGHTSGGQSSSSRNHHSYSRASDNSSRYYTQRPIPYPRNTWNHDRFSSNQDHHLDKRRRY